MPFIRSAHLVAVMLAGLLAPPPAWPSTAPARHPGAVAGVRLAAGKLWAPKKSTGGGNGKARDGEDDTSREEEELLKPRGASPPSGSGARPRLHIKSQTPVAVDVSEGASDEEGASADDGEGDSPRVNQPPRRGAAEEEGDEADEDDDDAPLPSLAPVLPRLGVLSVGASTIGRSFHYDTPLQGDSAAARLGYAIGFEAFPLLRTPPGFQRRLGLGGSFERQSGSASLVNAADGTTISYPLTQSRWGVDLRAFFPFGPHLLLVPAIGFGRADADLGARTGTLPSACLPASARPCVADVAPSFVTFDVNGRLAVSSLLAFSITGGYEQGVSVASGLGRISSSEATASMHGFHVDLGARYLLQDWLALEAELPFRRHAYSFTPAPNSTVSYHGAVDSYYGLVVGVAVLSP